MRALLLFILLWPGLCRGNPLDAFGFGARGPALGSAYAAVADDSAAGYYNPAGLARGSDLRIDLGYQAAFPQLAMAGERQPIEPTRGLTVGLLAPGTLLGVRFAFAATLFLPDQHLTRLRVLRYELPRLQLYDNRTQRLYMAANLAVRIVRRLYVGAGLVFMSHTQGLVRLRGVLPIGDAESSQFSTATDVDLVAVRYPQAGVTVEATRHLTLAAVYRHRFMLDVDQGFEIRADLGDIGAEPAVRGAFLRERARSVDLFQPWQLVLGAALRLPCAERVLLSLDLTFARYSEMPAPAATFELALDVGRFNDLVRLRPSATYPSPGFHDILIPAAGVEWRALAGLFRQRLDLDLRAGYRYEPSPVPEQSGDTSLGDADKHTFSLGAGVTLSRLTQILPRPLSLDLFAALTFLPERRFLKSDPRSPVGDFTVGGVVPYFGLQSRWRF